MIFVGTGARAENVEHFSSTLSNFYLAPSQDAFTVLQQNAEQLKAELKAKGNGADWLVAVMIARISQKYGWPIVDGTLGERAKEILAGKSPQAKFVGDDAQVNPTKLDVWWVSYFATGEERYLENIFQYAGLELPKGNLARMTVIGAATWSFKSNCQQHQSILEFAKRQLAAKHVSERQAQFLRDCIAAAQPRDNAWVTREGKPVPNSDSMKSIKGFGGWLMTTSDPDWKEKWNTSPETVPEFHGASQVDYGKRLTILTFYSNPQVDAAGGIEVLCDIKLMRPDGSVPVEQKGIECASGKLQGNPLNTRLTAAVIDFIGEDGDPPGVWRVEVTMTDKVRNVTVPLKTEFTLNKKPSRKSR